MNTFASSEDPDDQVLHCYGKKDLQTKESNILFKIITWHP